MIGREYLVPYLRHFPIWKCGPVRDFLTGVPTGAMAWQPNWYGQRAFPTLDEARRWHRDHHGKAA